MKSSLILVAAAVAMAVPQAGFARSKVSVDTAEQICLKRAQKFSKTPYGRGADYPDPNQVKDRYRSCVYAKSGRYPQRGLNIRGVHVSFASGY